MRRTLIALAASSLLLPAVAIAKEATYRGLPAAEPSVQFAVRIKDGEVKKVTKFRFFGIVLQCDQGQLTVDNDQAPLPAIDVKKDEFSERFASTNNQTVKVTGEFSKQGKRAEGTLRIKGDFTTQDGTLVTNCDSAKVGWKAQT